MSASIPDPAFREEFGFDSRGSEIIISDEPGDNTVRPARPLLLKLAMAERERIARWEKQLGQAPEVSPPDQSDSTEPAK
jgi:hypothetical protein